MTVLLTLLALLAATPEVPAPPLAGDAGGSPVPAVTMEEVEGGGPTDAGLKADDGGVMTRPRLDLDAGSPLFEWTQEQLQTGAHGLALVRCDLSAEGIPHACEVVHGAPGIQAGQLEQFAQALRFKPATVNGQAIAVQKFVLPIRLEFPADPLQLHPKLVAVASAPKLLPGESKPWSWTKEQLAAPKPLRVRARCRLTARGRLTKCAQSERPAVVSEEQLSDFLDGLRYEPARDKDGNPLDTLNLAVPVVLYNP